jgi:hypothetical protein
MRCLRYARARNKLQASALLAVAVCSCVSNRAAAPPETAQAANAIAARTPSWVWSYDVVAGDPSARALTVEATFAPMQADAVSTDDDAVSFVHDVQVWANGRWMPAIKDNGAWDIPCRAAHAAHAIGCRVRYVFALGDAAASIDTPDTAIRAGDVVVAPPSTWLLRPVGPVSPYGPDARFRLCVRGAPFETGVEPQGDAPAGTYQAKLSDMDASSLAVFGPFVREALVRNDAHVLLAVAPQGITLTAKEVEAWIAQAVDAIAHYYGTFPVRRTLVIVAPGTARHTEGETLGDGGPSVILRTGSDLTEATVARDWVATHELLHVTMPSIPREDMWLSEGIATYVEPIVRARAGLVPVAQYWADLIEGLPKGLPEPGDQGLERTHTWGRTYWGGALFCFLADLRIREETRDAKSFDDALRGIVAEGDDVGAHWSVLRFLQTGDRATGTNVLIDLYRTLALRAEPTDLDALWKRLGVRRAQGRVLFDDTAPLAALRRSITAVERRVDGPGPKG